MATSDTELMNEVRLFTDYDVNVLPREDLKTVVGRAKQHIRVRKDIASDTFDWYATADREEALFWLAALFAKVSVGELDSGDIQVGAIDIEGLLASDDGEVTTWAKNSQIALRAMDSGGDYPFGVGITAPLREDRIYGEEDESGDVSL